MKYMEGSVVEKPAVLRGFMLDSARCMESRDYYRRFIHFIAERGMNTLVWHFSDDQGLSIDFPSVSGIAERHAYSVEEVRELVEYAQSYGVTIIPELETLGHSRYITRHERYQHLSEGDGDFTAICPLHPETRTLMKNLLRDVADLFPSEYIHVGMDEVALGQHPITREALKTRSKTDVFADYIHFIYKEVTQLGRKMVMWVDANSYTTGVMESLPRDILTAVWQYSPEVAPDLSQNLLDLGFDVLLCPALITYDQQVFPGSIALPNIECMSSFQSLQGKGSIRGVVTTIWTPMRYMHDTLWPAISWASGAMRVGGRYSLSLAIKLYLKEYHDTAASRKLVQAIADCFRLAPERKEYLGLLNASVDGERIQEYEVSAEAWGRIAIVMKMFLPSVVAERQVFETLQQFAAFMSYLYKRARGLAEQTCSSSEWEMLLEEGVNWVRTLEIIWERERFSDDTRKNCAVYTWEENEYLLARFRMSVAQLSDGIKSLSAS